MSIEVTSTGSCPLEIDYLHAMLETLKTIALNSFPPETTPSTGTYTQQDNDPYNITFPQGTIIDKIKLYVGIDCTINIQLSDQDNSDHDLSMSIGNVVVLNYTCNAETVVTITGLPINSTFKVYTA
jgi:hypothetical protein